MFILQVKYRLVGIGGIITEDEILIAYISHKELHDILLKAFGKLAVLAEKNFYVKISLIIWKNSLDGSEKIHHRDLEYSTSNYPPPYVDSSMLESMKEIIEETLKLLSENSAFSRT